MGASKKVPTQLVVERPRLPPASAKEMRPRARSKYGRAPSKTKVVRSDSYEALEQSGIRPASSASRAPSRAASAVAQGAVRNFLRTRAINAKGSMAEAKPKEQDLTNEEVVEDVQETGTPTSRTPARTDSNGAKTIGRVARTASAAFAVSRQSKTYGRGSECSAVGTQHDPASADAEEGTAGNAEAAGGNAAKLNRRRTGLGAVDATKSPRASVHMLDPLTHALSWQATGEHEALRSPQKGTSKRKKDYKFRPNGNIDERMKRLDQKRNERLKLARSQTKQEDRKRRFEDMDLKEREALSKAFARFDVEGSGALDHAEVIDCLREFGLTGTTGEEKREILNICLEVTASDDEKEPGVRTPADVEVDLLDLALTVVPCVRMALIELRGDELLKQFFKFDEDGSGKLSQKEMKELARGMGLDPRMMDMRSGSGDEAEVDFETFQAMIIRGREQLERICREKERHVQYIAGLSERSFQRFRKDLVALYDVFVRYDKDGSGALNMTELMSMLLESGLAPRDQREKQDMYMIFHDHGNHEQLVGLVDTGPDEINFHDFLEIVVEIRHYRQESCREEQFERFMRYDRDKSGSLTTNEISRLLADCGLMPMNRIEQEEIANLISLVDMDGSGYIDFGEFQELSQRIDEKLRSFRYEEELEFAMRLGFTELQMRDLRQVFVTLDVDGSQKLDADEVRIGMAMMDKHVTHKVFEDTFHALDNDGSGELDFFEFLSFMRKIVDSQGPMGNSEQTQKLAQKPKDLDTRILRRVLEYFRLTKQYIQSLEHVDLVGLFCEYFGVKPEQNLHTALDVKTVGDLYEVAQERDLAMQGDKA